MQLYAPGGKFRRVLRAQSETSGHAGKAQLADFDRRSDAMAVEIRPGEMNGNNGARKPQPQQQNRHCRQEGRKPPPSFHARRSN